MTADSLRKLLLVAALAVHRGILGLVRRLIEIDRRKKSGFEKGFVDPDQPAAATFRTDDAIRGAPKHWVDRVRRYAPELLLPTIRGEVFHDRSAYGRAEDDLPGKMGRHRADGPSVSGENREWKEMIAAERGRRFKPYRGSDIDRECVSEYPGRIPEETEHAPGKSAVSPKAEMEKNASRGSVSEPGIQADHISPSYSPGDDRTRGGHSDRSGDESRWRNPGLVSTLSSRGISASRQPIGGAPMAEMPRHEANVARVLAGTRRSAVILDGKTPSSARPVDGRSPDAPTRNGMPPTAAASHRRQREAPADVERHSRLSLSGKASAELLDDGKILSGSEANIVFIHTEADGNRPADPISMHHGRSDAEPGGRDDGAVQFEDRPWPRLPDEEPTRSGADDRSGPWPLLRDETRVPEENSGDRAALRDHARLRRLQKEQAGEIWNAWPF